MKPSVSIRNIILIWLGWAIVMVCFQTWVHQRVNLARPDKVLNWTSTETTATSNNDKPFLIDLFLNEHVAWDSEFYLAIADTGYDSNQVRKITSDLNRARLQIYCLSDEDTSCLSLSSAFFPVYPLLTKAISYPLRIFPLTNIANLTLAAMIVSLLGALGAMLSLFYMSRSLLGDDGGVRAAFYLLIFPSGFFLAQVYSEGTFIGITFACLAFLTARKWGWAAFFGALSAWTRPGGAIVVLPMVMVWLMDRTWKGGWKPAFLKGLAALSPAISFGIWSLTPLATNFYKVESLFFGRRLLNLASTLFTWKAAYHLFLAGNSTTRFYYGLEFAAIILAIATCILLLRKRPELALYGLAMITFAFTSGAAQGMVRYVLAAPPLFLVLSRWGKNQVFDRVWTLLSVLIMGLEVILFTFDFWVA